MKTLIKQYKHPQVNPNLLNQILLKQQRKNIFFVLLQFIAWSAISILFIQNLISLNFEYYSVFSAIGNIGIIFQVVFQIIVGVIHFVFNNLYLIFGLYFLSFVSNVYSIQ